MHFICTRREFVCKKPVCSELERAIACALPAGHVPHNEVTQFDARLWRIPRAPRRGMWSDSAADT
jgi:hypothetical protein